MQGHSLKEGKPSTRVRVAAPAAAAAADEAADEAAAAASSLSLSSSSLLLLLSSLLLLLSLFLTPLLPQWYSGVRMVTTIYMAWVQTQASAGRHRYRDFLVEVPFHSTTRALTNVTLIYYYTICIIITRDHSLGIKTLFHQWKVQIGPMTN